MKKKIGYFFSITCISFTIIMLLYAILSKVMNATVNDIAIYMLFAICAMVSLAILITDRFIPAQSIPLRMLIDFIDVFFTVFLFGGGVLRMFPFTWDIMPFVFIMLTVAYFGCLAILWINEQIISVGINKKISEMKKGNHKEEK